MSIKNFEDKDLKDKEVKMEEDIEYFFPDIDGQSITVKAKNPAEAEKKARALINSNQ